MLRLTRGPLENSVDKDKTSPRVLYNLDTFSLKNNFSTATFGFSLLPLKFYLTT